jgi:hypothetical protein
LQTRPLTPRRLPTETDFDGRRVVRNIAEYTHLADHVALASTVHHLAHAIDRVRTELEEAAYDDAKPDEDVLHHPHGVVRCREFCQLRVELQPADGVEILLVLDDAFLDLAPVVFGPFLRYLTAVEQRVVDVDP